MTIEEPIFIVDIGSSSVKAGYSGEDTPSYIIPSVVAPYPKHTQSIESYLSSSVHPVHRGEIKNWDHMEKLWASISEAASATGDISIMLIESQRSTFADRQKWAEMLFDKFHYPSICVCNSAMLTVFASGRTTGLAVELGADICSSTPVFEGLVLSHAAISMDFGGQDITKSLKKMLNDRKITIDLPSAQTVKERLAYAVKPKITGPVKKGQFDKGEQLSFSLPDGTDVQVEKSVLSACNDRLFHNPALPLTKGLVPQTYQSLALCDDSVKKDLANNIVISGGSSMLPGLGDRLFEELREKVSTEFDMGRCAISGNHTRVIPTSQYSERGFTSQRKHAAWTGGSILSSFGTYHKHLKITKQEWEENPDVMLDIKSF